ncbi:unnamed protein product [Citrullus colocynthis]|uniref:Uncharacterized protein n=1 Tax=Citrullus colocynthis TaxID=252529 RepID=A0ABP0YSQ3_9ROSI
MGFSLTVLPASRLVFSRFTLEVTPSKAMLSYHSFPFTLSASDKGWYIFGRRENVLLCNFLSQGRGRLPLPFLFILHIVNELASYPAKSNTQSSPNYILYNSFNSSKIHA